MQEHGFEIVPLKSGVNSLRRLDNRETFHPGIGPIAEAKILHVDQHQLARRASRAGRLVIWDVGLGAAANAIAAINELQNSAANIEIHSFDLSKSALKFAHEKASELEYPTAHAAMIEQLIKSNSVRLHDRLSWHLHLGDFREHMLRSDIPNPNSIFYDPYSPSSNIEMWTLEHFSKLQKRLGQDTPYLMTNYTRSTIVRVTWLLAGFAVGIGSTIGEKEETTIASNRLSELALPLGRKWLERVKISHSSAPLRGEQYNIAPIVEHDLAALAALPQFCNLSE